MNSINSDIDYNVLEDYALKKGKRQLDVVLKVLGKGTIFIQALETEVGKEILTETIERLTWLLERIADDPDCPDVLKIEYKMLRGICRIWAAKIMNFNKAKKNLKTI